MNEDLVKIKKMLVDKIDNGQTVSVEELKEIGLLYQSVEDFAREMTLLNQDLQAILQGKITT